MKICTICRHRNRREIDNALLAQEPYRHIAAQFGTSTGALQRHREHLPARLVKAKSASEVVQADSLLERLKAINRETAAILADARDSQNHPVALQAIARVERQLELEARLLGELSDAAKIAIGINLKPQPRYDLSVFSQDELAQLKALLLKAVITRQGEAAAAVKIVDTHNRNV